MVRALFLLVAFGAVENASVAQDTPDEIEFRILKFGDGMTVFEDGLTPRLRVRANFYRTQGGDPWHSSPGQVSIEFGLPRWKAAYEKALEAIPAGQRWRLGSNYWTNFSSSFEIRAGGQTLPPGYYYLVLEKSGARSWKLIFLDPADIRKLQIDPWHVNRQESGVARLAVDLEPGESAGPSEALEIKMKLQDDSPRNFRIQIRFGPIHLVSVPLQVELE